MKEQLYKRLQESKIYRYRRKRIKKMKKRVSIFSKHGKKLHHFFSPYVFSDFLERVGAAKEVKHTIVVPDDFSFNTNFDKCIHFFRCLVTSFSRKKGDVVLDFSRCWNVSVSALTLIKALYYEFMLAQMRYARMDNMYEMRKLKIHSKVNSKDVKKYLHSLRLCKFDDFKDEDGEVLSLDLIRGKNRRIYQENTKGRAIREIVQFINTSLEPVNKSLTPEGLNNIEALVSEILNNAEDHSHNNCEWYALGIAFHEKIKGEDVVELNLVILNFGDTMYEGFEGTKDLNQENYAIVHRKYNSHSDLFEENVKFEKESLFMLYMLNEGISRLKFEDDSRGNGTMQFLDAFAQFGSFGCKNPDFVPQLNVISGHTVLLCDHEVAPYMEGNHLKLSLNKVKDLKLLPDKEYLKYNCELFPGTIIECKIYLNEQFFDEILDDNNE